MKIKIIRVIVAALLGSLTTANAADLKGRLHRIIDGDTFDLRISDGSTARVRLCGIDAPERSTPSHQLASSALEGALGRGPITCRPVGEGTVCDGRSPRFSRDRIVAQCSPSDAFDKRFDVAEHLALNGHVCDWPKFSGGYYQFKERNLKHKVCVRQ